MTTEFSEEMWIKLKILVQRQDTRERTKRMKNIYNETNDSILQENESNQQIIHEYKRDKYRIS